jgi:hypothetical protein
MISCSATSRAGVKCTQQFIPTPALEQFCMGCIQKKENRRLQNQRAKSKQRGRLSAALLQSTTGLAQPVPVVRRCHDCFRLQSDCDSSLFQEGASRCVSCATKRLDTIKHRRTTPCFAKRISQSTVLTGNLKPSMSQPVSHSEDDLATPTANSPALPARLHILTSSANTALAEASMLPPRPGPDIHLPTTRSTAPHAVPFVTGRPRPKVATGPSVPWNTGNAADQSGVINGPQATSTVVPPSRKVKNVDPWSPGSPYGVHESETSSTQMVPSPLKRRALFARTPRSSSLTPMADVIREANVNCMHELVTICFLLSVLSSPSHSFFLL